MPEGPLASAYVTIEPDLQGFEAELRAELDAALSGQGQKVNVGIGVDDAEFQSKKDAIKAQIAELEANEHNVLIGANDDEAKRKLDALRAELLEMEANEHNIRVGADTEEADRKLAETKLAADAASGESGGGGLGGLAAAGLALAPAIVPAAAASAAGIGALASLTGIAAVGLGSFAALAIPSFQGVGKEVQTITADQDKLNAAITLKDKEQALQKLQQDFAKIPPEQRPVVQGILDLKQSLDDVAKTVQPQIFAVFESFLQVARDLLPQMAGPARETALALRDLGDGLDRAVNSPGFHQFNDWVTGQARGAIDAIGIAIGNVAKGFGFLLEDFAPLVPALEGGMDRITAAFARWAQNLGASQGFQNFLQYMHQNSAALKSLLTDVAGALVSLVRAASGFGAIEIRVLDDVAKAISAIASTPGLGPVAVDVGLLAVAVSKLVSFATGLGIVKLALAGLGTSAGEAGAAGGIGALVTKLTGGAGAVELLSSLGGAVTSAAVAVPALATALGVGTVALSQWIGHMLGADRDLHQVSDSAASVVGRAGEVTQAAVNAGKAFDTLAQGLGVTQEAFPQLISFFTSTGGSIRDLQGTTKQASDAIVAHLRDVASGATGASQQEKDAANLFLSGIHEMDAGALNAQDHIVQAVSRIGAAFRDTAPQIQTQINGITNSFKALDPDLRTVGSNAIASLTESLKNHQPVEAAGQDTLQIIAAFNDLDKIPGAATQAMGVLKQVFDRDGKSLGIGVKAIVDDLTGKFDTFAPDVKQRITAAMAQLDAGLKTGNQQAINDATTQLIDLSNRYGGIVPPINQAAKDAMTALNNSLSSGNALAISRAAQDTVTILKQYQNVPQPLKDATDQAMRDLNTALASGNQAAIDDATHKLGDLVSKYQGTVQPISGAGGDAGDGFGGSMAQKLRDQLPNVGNVLGDYDKAIQNGINPILAAVNAQTVHVFGGGFFPAAAGGIRGPEGGLTNGPQFLVGEGRAGYPEAVVPTDPAYRDNAHALMGWLGSQLGMASGGIVGLQGGGLVTGANEFLAWLRAQNVNFQVSSGFRAGAGFHGTGQAVDLVGDMARVATLVNSVGTTILEGIHNPDPIPPAVSIKNGAPVGPDFWGGPTWAEHSSHVHVALPTGEWAPGAGLAGGGCPPGAFCSGADVPKPPTFAQWNPSGTASSLSEGWAFNRGADNMYQNVVKYVDAQAAQRAAAAASAGATFGATPTGGAFKEFARQHLHDFGWGDDQFPPLDQLWNRESGWNPNARNASSGAFGIPQALPPSKMGAAAAGGDAGAQILWGLGYIHDRWGSPAGAWANEVAAGWYEKGGILGLANGGIVNSPTLSMIGERGPEAVVPLGQGGAFGGNVTIDARIVFQGDVTDNIDARIQRAHAAQADRITRKLGLRGVNPAPGGILR